MNSSKKIILSVAIPIPLNHLFDYLPPDNCNLQQLKAGLRVKVPFGKQTKIAVLIKIKTGDECDISKLKQAEAILDAEPLLSSKDIQLLNWAKYYYHHPIGDVFISAFPTALRKGKSTEPKSSTYFQLTATGKAADDSLLHNAPKQLALLKFLKSQKNTLSNVEIATHFKLWRAPLKALINKDYVRTCNAPGISDQNSLITQQTSLTANAQQLTAIQSITSQLDQFAVYLLEGVTGSGKTEVYLQIIEKVLARNQQVLVLLPEITLTPQLEARFKQRFAVPIETYHSQHSESQRQSAWLAMQKGNSPIMLGTRSALFTPMPKAGLIILDEEHDASFKQQEGFRFSARDVAIVRAKMLNIPIILGSATPSLESLYNVDKKRYQLLRLPHRAGNATPPRLALLDIRNQSLQEGLSPQLIRDIQRTLAKKEQVLLFLNRRGFAPTLICHSCGWVAQCSRCDANLVVHYQQQKLRCHHCACEQALPRQCIACKSEELKPLGLGTERVESALHYLFPEHKSVRLDRDSTQRKGALDQHLAAINQGQVDIILGTQMLAKGHHFPNVTLVVLLDVDSGLFSIDFHAPERLAQLIIQVAGRAGRAEKKGRVIMQTRQPEHPLLNTLILHGYQAFAKAALAERKSAELPPYSYQALLRSTSHEKDSAFEFLLAVAELINSHTSNGTLVLGPVAAPMAKRAGQFRYQLLLQHKKRKQLHLLLNWLMPEILKLKQARKIRWSLDIDPIDLY
ncbi:primosomal protein N' [Methyloprofundus sedimenti]|uniref:primosomal protein N' n=1 Tax=Methyloprofundus sedimenti TaxID=1420851 RepID=UPI0009B65B92|nr:primosomal protein N' [Methyloprofundus sedimenti]